ncbi:MAG TPA: hypothetical protein VIK06_10430 [Candidatus Limnocylindrales bacterium]|jgi:hypothetical protein
MAALLQNQAQAGPPVNVLHDQNIPNTLGGIGPPATAAGLRVSAGALLVAAIVFVFVAVLVILLGRLV